MTGPERRTRPAWHRRRAAPALAGAACALAILLALGAASPKPAPEPFVRAPDPVVWRVDEHGYPLVSPAGFVEIADGGPGFLAGRSVPEIRRHMEARGSIGLDDWGDPEAFVRLGRLLAAWHRSHPDGPRLIIHEISSPLAGYGDFDGDGRADHLTHQNGFNVNILTPADRSPEVVIDLGTANDSRFHPGVMRELVNALFRAQVPTVTTNVRARLFDDIAGVPPLDGRWRQVAASGGTRRHERDDGVSVLEREALRDHADHINAQFSPRP